MRWGMCRISKGRGVVVGEKVEQCVGAPCPNCGRADIPGVFEGDLPLRPSHGRPRPKSASSRSVSFLAVSILPHLLPLLFSASIAVSVCRLAHGCRMMYVLAAKLGRKGALSGQGGRQLPGLSPNSEMQLRLVPDQRKGRKGSAQIPVMNRFFRQCPKESFPHAEPGKPGGFWVVGQFEVSPKNFILFRAAVSGSTLLRLRFESLFFKEKSPFVRVSSKLVYRQGLRHCVRVGQGRFHHFFLFGSRMDLFAI